jgi:hypothetical protein
VGPPDPEEAHRAPKEPVGTDEPTGLKLNTCDQNSTGSDIGHATSSSEGPQDAPRAPMGPIGPQRSPSELNLTRLWHRRVLLYSLINI